MSSPNLFLFLKIVLVTRCPLNFLKNLRSAYQFLQKNPRKAMEILIKIMWNLYMNLESVALLTISSLPIDEHGIIFHLFRSSISTMFHSIQDVSCAFPLLNLFLKASFFFNAIVRLFYSFHFQSVHFWCLDMQLIFIYWSCVLKPFWTCLLALIVFLWLPLNFL